VALIEKRGYGFPWDEVLSLYGWHNRAGQSGKWVLGDDLPPQGDFEQHLCELSPLATCVFRQLLFFVQPRRPLVCIC